jgi:hypothetical protein
MNKYFRGGYVFTILSVIAGIDITFYSGDIYFLYLLWFSLIYFTILQVCFLGYGLKMFVKDLN